MKGVDYVVVAAMVLGVGAGVYLLTRDNARAENNQLPPDQRQIAPLVQPQIVPQNLAKDGAAAVKGVVDLVNLGAGIAKDLKGLFA